MTDPSERRREQIAWEQIAREQIDRDAVVRCVGGSGGRCACSLSADGAVKRW